MPYELLAAALDPVQQDYLLEARQMQAMSFAVHIPIVCFGIAFPPLVMFVEWLHLRTGDPVAARAVNLRDRVHRVSSPPAARHRTHPGEQDAAEASSPPWQPASPSDGSMRGAEPIAPLTRSSNDGTA